MDLHFDRLASALTLLTDSDRKIVGEAVQLIREGEHVGALARLSALAQTNPNNSSLRILTAYAQLQLGNLTGAFDEAKRAHEAPNGNSYKCFFLAKLALLTGDKATCQRELDHVKRVGDMKQDARQLEGELKKAKTKG
jgi:Flp pilus assembly protein TadD